MPIYCYECKACKQAFEESYKMDDREIPLKNPCPSCGKIELFISLGALGIIDPIRAGITKCPEGFKDRLKAIKKSHPLSNFNIPG